MNFFQLAFAVSVLALSACSSSPTSKSTADSSRTGTASKQNATSAPISASEISAREQQSARTAQALAGKSVYFDYDAYDVKATYNDLLAHVREFLKSAPNYSVTLEGHADDRGSTEYNLALGQKRSESVKRNLRVLGVAEKQMEATSYGKEKPRATCPEEKCWAENRRVDFSFKRP